MRKALIAGLFGTLALGLVTPVEAQPRKDPRPGYMIIRVLLDDGAPPVAAVQPGANGQPPAAPQARPIDLTHSIAVAVPYTSIENKLFFTDKPQSPNNPYWPAFKHKYGQCYAYTDRTFIQFFQVQGLSLEKDLKDTYDKWAVKRSYDGIHGIIEKALMIGRVDEALKYTDEYLRMPKVLPSLPQSSKFKAFEKAYTGLPEKMAKKPDAHPQAEEWRGKLGATSNVQGDHYTMFYFDGNAKVEAERRMKVLEENYKAFYLWHALNGLELSVPAKKMLVVLADSPNRVKDYREGLDGLPILCDAFYAQGHEMLVLSPERMDPNGRQFASLAKGRFTNWNRDELLKGKLQTVGNGKATEAAQMMMLAVADQYLTEEGDNAAISREGTRQLMAATGIIPSNVQLPRWLENGVGYFFQRAKGPRYYQDQNGVKMAVALATGWGAPNYEFHRDFDIYKEGFGFVPERTLMSVLLNTYYTAIASGRNFDIPPPKRNDDGTVTQFAPPPDIDPDDPNANAQAVLKRRQEIAQKKADCVAWALCYYLQKDRLNGMQKFYKELSRMPRDMRVDSEIIMTTFCKSFGLVRPDGTPDIAAVKNFAENWLSYMSNVPHFDYSVQLNADLLNPFGQGGLGVPGTNPGGTGPGGTGPGGGGGGTPRP